ncbi:MAG: hypothetical protein ACLF0P_07610 [Thermoanaerobaculia bacterium]
MKSPAPPSRRTRRRPVPRRRSALPARAPVPVLALALGLTLGLTAAPAAFADDVYLTNGQVFEGVVARHDGDKVRIRLAHGGEMGLPASWVERVEEAETPYQAYLERRGALGPDATAGDWLELAVWARSRGLDDAARKAALRAAALDPELEGLGAVLRPAGYVFVEEAEAWLTESEAMARRGYVRVGSEWVPAEVAAQRRRLAEASRRSAEEAAEERARAESLERLDRAITLLALSQLQEIQEERRTRRSGVPVTVGVGTGVPVGIFPGAFHPKPPRRRPPKRPPHPKPPPHADPKPDHHRGSFTYDALAGRQPGSIIPLVLDPGAARGDR